jgi:hypothetical protein
MLDEFPGRYYSGRAGSFSGGRGFQRPTHTKWEAAGLFVLSYSTFGSLAFGIFSAEAAVSPVVDAATRNWAWW